MKSSQVQPTTTTTTSSSTSTSTSTSTTTTAGISASPADQQPQPEQATIIFAPQPQNSTQLSHTQTPTGPSQSSLDRRRPQAPQTAPAPPPLPPPLLSANCTTATSIATSSANNSQLQLHQAKPTSTQVSQATSASSSSSSSFQSKPTEPEPAERPQHQQPLVVVEAQTKTHSQDSRPAARRPSESPSGAGLETLDRAPRTKEIHLIKSPSQNNQILVTLSRPSNADSVSGYSISSGSGADLVGAPIASQSASSSTAIQGQPRVAPTPQIAAALASSSNKKQQKADETQSSRSKLVENELRRIASERRKNNPQTDTNRLIIGAQEGPQSNRPTEKKSSSIQTNKAQTDHQSDEQQLATNYKSRVVKSTSHNSQLDRNSSSNSKSQIAPPNSASKQPQPESGPSLLVDQSNPHQLAIYINGKIRSNSIFCRSTSSNSFSSLFGRFHTSATSDQQHPSSKSPTRNIHQEPKISVEEPSNSRRSSDSNSSSPGPIRRKSSSTDGDAKCPPGPGQATTRRGPIRTDSQKATTTTTTKKKKQRNSSSSSWFALGGSGSASSFKSRLSGRANFIANYLVKRRAKKPRQKHKGARRNSSSSSLDPNNTSSYLAPVISVKKSAANRQAEDDQGDSTVSSIDDKLSYKLNPSSMFLRKAMRYYRLWIYCANITIFLGVLIFIVSALYVASDFRIKLIVSSPDSAKTARARLGVAAADGPPETAQTADEDDSNYFRPIDYLEPSAIVAYLVVAIQAGILQMVGCFGAIRMKERWIQAFWYLILALVVFDAVFLVYWLSRYDLMSKSLRQQLLISLKQNYAHSGGSGHSSNLLLDSGPTSIAIEAAATNKSSIFAATAADPFKVEALEQKKEKKKRKMKQSIENSFHQIVPSEVITDIIDKIQAESHCCGIVSSLDYKRSKWRLAKLEQLARRLNWTLVSPAGPSSSLGLGLGPTDDNNGPNNRSISQLKARLLYRVPLVPASCCIRRPSLAQTESVIRKPNQPISPSMDAADADDDDEGPRQQIRVPAWSPSMVVDDLHRRRNKAPSADNVAQKSPIGANGDDDDDDEDQDESESGANQQHRQGRPSEPELTLEQLLDSRWTGTSKVMNDDHQSAARRRLQAKQNYYSTPDSAPIDDDDGSASLIDSSHELALGAHQSWPPQPPPRDKRWSVESRIDEQGNVLTWLADFIENDYNNDLDPSAELADDWQAKAMKELNENLLDQNGAFVWPNKFSLSFEQFELVKDYLAAAAGSFGDGDGEPRPRRSIFSNLIGNQATPQEKEKSKDSSALLEQLKLARNELMQALAMEPEISCTPRSYFDQATIHTAGCHPSIKAWLDSSAHILFVTGFCVLTVLKFCSLVLLRLEIREMIHKIRVLKGMATEYNALHDLEAYLPRPSVCAQAAELTPSGVAAALPSSSTAIAAAAAASSGGMPAPSGEISASGSANMPPYRLGGSFSEAVVAAAAAAAQAQHQQQHGSKLIVTGSLGSGAGRASSMKGMTAAGGMLMPGGCSGGAFYAGSSMRPTSASAAHLHLSAAGNLSTGRDLFGSATSGAGCSASAVMSRRHTAVSVCPAAAAAAAAAAHHLMSRRGTYIANPVFSTSSLLMGHCAMGPTAAPFAQHRHSAHTIAMHQPSADLSSKQLSMKQQTLTSRTAAAATQKPHRLLSQDSSQNTTARSTFEHQSSADSAQLLPAPSQSPSQTGATLNNLLNPNNCRLVSRSSAGSQQLLSLMQHTFKRQSSGGAQSACNFSLDPTTTPSASLESRRSIH